MRKFMFLLALVLMCPEAVKPQTDEQQEASLIIALDIRSEIGKYLGTNTGGYSQNIKNILETNNVSPDYVSGVLYGKEASSLSPEGFSRKIISPQKDVKDYSSVLKGLYTSIPQGLFYSITSFARPYSLMALKDTKSTNRTFLTIMTDGRYNGNDDYYGEINYMQMNFSEAGKQKFKDDILNVQTNYFCEFKDQMKVPGGYVQLYEFVPLQKYFAIESVVDFPHRIVAERKKSCYSIEFSGDYIPNKDYEIKKIQLALSAGGRILKTEDYTPGTTVRFDIDKDDVKDASLEMKAWVRFCDGIYNNTILHPYGSKLQGAEGLNRKIEITGEKDAEILGIIPLPDFLFYMSFWTSSQDTAATSWGWIIMVVVILGIVYIIYRSNIYKTNGENIKI